MNFQVELKNDDRETLADVLQSTVIDLITYGLITKQAHWNVVGPFFKPVHEFLDEVHGRTQGLVDSIAERMVALGFSPNGQGSDAAFSVLSELDKGFLKDSDVLLAMAERTLLLGAEMRKRAEIIDGLDTVTADMYHLMIESIEKDLWMFRAQLS